MLIGSIKCYSPIETEDYAWSALSLFKNHTYSSKAIARVQSLDCDNKRLSRNIEKQGRQLSRCLVLAAEYRNLAKTSTLATRAVSLYYCCMHLALCEILLKQSGDSSLDRAASEHRHHGLVSSHTINPDGAPREVLSKLQAKPVSSGSQRRGTFDLWHRSARHMPIVGKETIVQDEHGRASSRNSPLYSHDDVRMALIPEQGISLRYCFERIPFMQNFLLNLDFQHSSVRGEISTTHLDKKKSKRCSTFTFHPSEEKALKGVVDSFILHPSDVNSIELVEFTSGLKLTFSENKFTTQAKRNFPYGVNVDSKEIHFYGTEPELNEFGFIYVALHILGMISRYDPDGWMDCVEKSNPVAVAADFFLNRVGERMSFLSLSELSRTYFVPDTYR